MNFELLDQWLMHWGLPENSYRSVLHIFVIVLLTGVVAFLSGRLLTRLERQFSRTRNLWDDTLLHAGRAPIIVLIWLLGLSWAAHTAERYSAAEIFGAIEPIRRIGVIALLAWFLVRFIGGAEKILVSAEKLREPVDPTTASAIGKLLRASVIITAVLIVMQSLGYSISGVLAFGGIGGIAVGFAAKDLLANFFGGLMIYLDRPFSVGDWIRSPDQEIEGTVEHIGWRLTTIRTFDKRPLYVPNAVFTSISVQNPSRMTHRRIYESVGVRYDDVEVLPGLLEDIRAMLRSHPGIDQTQTLMVNFNQFGPSALDCFIYTFTKTTNWMEYHDVKQDVLLKISALIRAAGAEIAYPTTTVHLAGVPVESPAQPLAAGGA